MTQQKMYVEMKKIPSKLLEELADRAHPNVLQLLGDGCLLAGGFIRCFFSGENLDDTDIDIFVSQKMAPGTKAVMASCMKKLPNSFFAMNYQGLKNKVQLIVSEMAKDPVHLISSFDITVAAAVVNGKSLRYLSSFREDIDSKVVNPISLRYNMTAERLFRFAGKGYSIPTSTYTVFSAGHAFASFSKIPSEGPVLPYRAGGLVGS